MAHFNKLSKMKKVFTPQTHEAALETMKMCQIEVNK